MYIQQFFIEGLGCASYLIGCEKKGVAAVVDPDRDVLMYLTAAEEKNLKIKHIIETHLHADHVSGNLDLAARTDAKIYIHEAAEAEFDHQPMREGDVIHLGETDIMVRYTPGHTPDSITLLLVDNTRGDKPWMALTGDTLFVGDVGRPDLVGEDVAKRLAHDLYHSIYQKLLSLDDGVVVYPGHGAGSLCGKAIGSVRSSTIGFERHFNMALKMGDQEAFVDFATDSLPEQPGNHKRIKAMNRAGPRPLGEIEPNPLSIQETIPLFQRGAVLIDLRPREEYVDLHIPGALHLDLDDQISNRVGFLLPPEVQVVLFLKNSEHYREVVLALSRVGYDRILGYLSEDIDVWKQMGLPVASGDIEQISIDDLHELIESSDGDSPVVVDVRERWEYARGHIPNAKLMPLGDLRMKIGELDPKKPVAVICQTGGRSQSASALLGQRGFEKVYNVIGGTKAWMEKGLPVEKEKEMMMD